MRKGGHIKSYKSCRTMINKIIPFYNAGPTEL